MAGGRRRYRGAAAERGRRDVRSLMGARGEGEREAAVFVVQRADADAFAPHDEADPEFGETLREAHAQGVEIYAYRCNVTREEITLDSPLPVLLG